MRKLIAAINITLDGFIAQPDGGLDWHFKYWDNELCESLCQQLHCSDILLLGGNTYQAMASYWVSKMNDLCQSRGDLILAELLKRIEKIVCSKTINAAIWQNTTVLAGDLIKEIQQLKLQPGKDIIILGSRQLLISLMELNLIDRYELWVHPITIKKGIVLFGQFPEMLEFRLIDQHTLVSGVVQLSYEVSR